mgnify:CR=1 FL=1
MNTKRKNARGITLIALVITIIVLLILAGITINALSGENGILKRATQAKSKTGRANALEQINLAIITARTEGLGQVDKTVLRDEITKAGMTVKTDGDDLPWEVVSDKYLFRINEDYTVEEISGIGLSKKELKLFNGQSETITATLTEGVTGTITWESADKNVATVENGKITVVGTTGSTTITAKVEGTEYEATCKVSIIQKVTSITAKNVTVGKNQTAKIEVTTIPTGLVEDLTYASDTPSIATVAEDGTVTGVATGSATITIKGKISTNVSTTCTVTVTKTRISVTAEQIAANPEKYYGQVAQNYTAGGKTYRIFYIDTEGKFGDKNTVYLKADWTANDTSLTASYTPSGTDLETYKKLNPSWAAKRGSNTSSWNKNEHAAAWLCSPSKWTTYLDTTKANYAIGAPTAEMYVASYNQVSHTTGNYKLGATYGATDAPGYIYTLNGKQSTISGSDYWTGNNTLDYTGYNSMYCGRNGSTGDYWWWLASPSAYDAGYVCLVGGSGAGCLSINDYSYAYGLCPLVSLKSSFQLEIEQ